MDALSNFVDKAGEGNDLFQRFKPDEPVRMRVLTNDPLVAIDKWGNTRFNFIIWNWDEKRPKVLSKGASILKQLKAIHTDPDYGDIRQIDLKVTASGEGMDTRYTVMPLPKSQELTKSIVEECKQVDLEKVVKNGIRLSKYNDGEELPEPEDKVEVDEEGQNGYAKESDPEPIIEDLDSQMEEPINLDSIPF